MSRRGTISAEEYKTLRMAAGLTQEEARQLHGCQNVRTIKNWESGRSYVSLIAEKRIIEVNALIYQTVLNAVDIFKNNPEAEVFLVSYTPQDFKIFHSEFEKKNLPKGIHDAIIARTYAALKEKGASVHVVTMDKPSYFLFLGQNGLKDGEDSRAAWAASRINN